MSLRASTTWYPILGFPIQGLAAFCVSLICVSQAMAIEPARDFLLALRERGYFEEAIEYLDAIAADPSITVPVEFRDILLFERGRTLLIGAANRRDPVLRSKDYDAAKAALAKFVEEKPNHLYTLSARIRIGQITMLRGNMLMDKVKLTPDKKKEIHTQSNAMYQEAIKIFSEIIAILKENPDGGVPKVFDAKKNPALVDKRDRWREDYLTSLITVADCREKLAQTYEPGSKEHTAALDAAIADYATLYEKYERMLAGLAALRSRASCLLQKTDPKDEKKRQEEALTLLDEVMKTDPSEPEVREIITNAFVLATQIWNQRKQYKQTYEEGNKWIDGARPSEQKEPDLQKLRLNVAEAALKYSDEIKAANSKDKNINLVLKMGALHTKDVTKNTKDKDLKARAESLLTSFPQNLFKEANEAGMPKTFDKAFEKGMEAMDSLRPAQLVLSTVKPRLEKEKDPAVKAELEAQVKEAEATLQNAKPEAMQYFNLALKLANEESSEPKLDGARYYLCYLNYDAGNYFDALVLGEFLAVRRPESSGARSGAVLAMAAGQQLYVAEKGENKDFEAAKVQEIAEYIVKKWPTEKEAGEAMNTLIPFLIKAGKLDQAEQYVSKLAEDSPQRGLAELKTGQAMWFNYLTGMKKVRELQTELQTGEKDNFSTGRTKAEIDADIKTAEAPLANIKQKALKVLADGVKRMEGSGQVNDTVARAVLSLAQIYIDTEQAQKGVEMLEHAKMGPITLLASSSPAVAAEGLAEDIYRSGLRAYISSLGSAKDAKATIDKAKQMMAGLKKRLGATPEGQAKLVQNYISIARDLQTQLDLVEDKKTRENLAKGFEEFLGVVGQEATELNVINWVADTFRRMGEAFGRDKDGKLTPQAITYYTKSMEFYKKLLEKGESQPNFFPSAATKPSIQRQMANTYRDIEKFQEAADMYTALLTQSQGLINVQMEAAYNFQAWAGSNADPETAKKYEAAMFGTGNTPKDVIWGWRKIADKLSGNEKFTAQYIECRYNFSFCRLKSALAQTDKELKKKRLGLALTEIGFTYKLNPELGGEQWRARFDSITKVVQRELGLAPTGLAALAPKESPAPAPK